MTPESVERHPLDDDEGQIEFDIGPDDSASRVYKPLLKPCIVGISAGFIVAFLGGVAASNSSPMSTGEVVGSFLQRVGVFIMLVAFCGILLAYRIPHMQKLSLDLPRFPNRNDFLSEFVSLIVGNSLFVAVIWGLVILLSWLPSALSMSILSLLVLTYVSLLAVVAVWQKGCRKAFAIGALTTVILSFYSGVTSFALGGLMSRGVTLPCWPFGIYFSVIVFNGLVCAGYFTLFVRESRPVAIPPLSIPSPSSSDRNDDERSQEARSPSID